MDNIQSNEDARKNRGMTPKTLVKFMISTCFARISSLDFERMDRMKVPLKKMLLNERKSHPGEDEKYDRLDEIIDGFFEYIKNPKIIEKIKNNVLTKAQLEELILSDVANLPKRKYDMSDLYREDLIAVYASGSTKRKSEFIDKKGQAHEYYDSTGRKIIITDVGQIVYEEWGGIHASLSVYLIQKQLDNGSFSNDLVCSSIAISQMHIPKYKEAVLEELLSDENINNGKVGPYIGRISRENKQNLQDLPHTERQNANGYLYRIDDEYVLEYDATEITAVIEAVRNINTRRKFTEKFMNLSSGNGGHYRSQFETRHDDTSKGNHDGHEEL